jgi:hypothetical protein
LLYANRAKRKFEQSNRIWKRPIKKLAFWRRRTILKRIIKNYKLQIKNGGLDLKIARSDFDHQTPPFVIFNL